MTSNAVNNRLINFRSAIFMALFAGLFGLLLLFLPDMDMVAFLLSASGLGLLCAGDKYYTEVDRQRIRRSFETAFVWLFLAILCAYAFIALARWLNFAGGVADFLDLHWPALVALTMCILAGSAGLRRASS